MQAALLRLFNAIQVDDKQDKNHAPSILEQTIKQGYILDPAILPSKRLLKTIKKIVGISGIKANASFHKSWSIVKNSSLEQLVTQQIIHYITTYGFESLGIYREDAVYIPREVLELPEIQDNIPLVIIKAMNKQEVLDSIIQLGSGIALARETLNDMMQIIETNRYPSDFVHNIANRELKARLHDFYDLVPTEPVEFLRHVISKLTNESLLIKNDYLIKKIKEANGKYLDTLIKAAPDDLATIFFRFKPLFLAMKSISRNKTYFNQLRKKANKLHRPLPEDYLNTVTARIKNDSLDIKILQQKLTEVNIFRKIRLAYALQYRLNPSDSIVYQIRNGRSWVTNIDFNGKAKITQQALDTVLDSIVVDIHDNIAGKTIYIPENIHYALPATEKQFTGHFPTGSSASVPQDMITGIHWLNTNKRVDLDLSVISESGKIGWDADYRSKSGDVLFSGDITDAPPPDGATELFYLKQATKEAKILTVNYYNFGLNDEVGCKILVAQEKPNDFTANYMVNVNNIVASSHINIDKKQTILGLIINVHGKNRLYFTQVSAGQSITSRNNEQAFQVRKYLIKKFVNALDLKEILIMADANVVTDKPEEGEYINLSPEMLDKTTIIDLLIPIIRDIKECNQS